MRDLAVVALEEVLDADLPVAGELRLRTLEEAKRRHVNACGRDLLRHAGQEVLERRGLRVGAHEHEWPPRAERERYEPQIVEVAVALVGQTRRCLQAPVERVRPRVVGALDGRAGPRALAQQRAPMAADVEERAQHVLPVAHEQDGNVCDSGREKRARPGQLVGATDVLPRTAEDPLLLDLEHGRVRVPAPRDGADAGRAHDPNGSDRGDLSRIGSRAP